MNWGAVPGTGEVLFGRSPTRERPCKWPASSSSCSLAEVRRLAGILLAPAARLKPFEAPPDANSGEWLTEGAYATDFLLSETAKPTAFDRTSASMGAWYALNLTPVWCSSFSETFTRGGVVGAD